MRIRNLLILGSLLLLISETGVVATALFPLIQPERGAAIWILLLIATMFAGYCWLLIPRFGRMRPGLNLLGKTDDPLLAWIYLHLIYTWVGVVNLIFVSIALVYSLGDVRARVSYAFLVGTGVAMAAFYNYFALNIVGQRYESMSGTSFLGVAALSKLSDKMFVAKKRQGLRHLLNALEMAGELFERRKYSPTDLDEVYATVESLIEIDELPYTELQSLARSLQTLPSRDEFPQKFRDFLQNLGWPGGFKRVIKRPLTVYQILSIALTAIIAIGSLLVVLPAESQHTLFKTAAEFVSDNSANILAAISIAIGFIGTVIGLAYNVPLGHIRKYWSAVK